MLSCTGPGRRPTRSGREKLQGNCGPNNYQKSHRHGKHEVFQTLAWRNSTDTQQRPQKVHAVGTGLTWL